MKEEKKKSLQKYGVENCKHLKIDKMDSYTQIAMKLHKQGSRTMPPVCDPPRPFPYAKGEAGEVQSLSLPH